MPLRQRLKNARNTFRNLFSDEDVTGTPSVTHSTHSDTNTLSAESDLALVDGNQQPGPSQPRNTSDIHGWQNSSQVFDVAQQHNPDTIGSISGAPTTSSQMRTTVEITPYLAAPKAQAIECTDPGTSPTTIDDDKSIIHVEIPTSAAPATFNTVRTKRKGVKEFSRLLRPATEVFGPIKQIVDTFVEYVDIYEMAEASQTEYDELQMRLEKLLEDLQRYFGEGSSIIMTSSMDNLCNLLSADGEALAPADEDQMTGTRFDRMSSAIDRLSPSLSARYKSAEGADLKRRECTPGTRIKVLAEVLNWTRGDGRGVYWLNGMAGTGKTTIAYSLCLELDSSHRLAASFFCSRTLPECRDVNLIVSTIAYQLARFSRPFHSVLSTALRKDPDLHRTLPHLQFEELIIKPLKEAESALPEGLVVVLDALDECDNQQSTGCMLDVLLSKAAGLPIKFVVLSRPEPKIRDQMTHERIKFRLVLHEINKGEVQTDIETYLRTELIRMKPSEAHIASLVKKAGALFIYAATAVPYIGYDNFQSDRDGRLRTILSASRYEDDGEHREIDQLYTTILEAALGDQHLRKIERDSIRQVLHTVICVREPLTVSGLCELLQMASVDRVRAALRPLWSVVHVVGSDELVTTLHVSFPDFMFNLTRSKAYHCDFTTHHQILSEKCLELIKRTHPQFNICGLESSYLADDDVPNIEERVAAAIPLDLPYACEYWMKHMEMGDCGADMREQLQGFLALRLLLWMEVLNLRKLMRVGVDEKLLGNEDIVELAEDGQRFVETFSSNSVSQSTPHIYVSMLAFWPRSSPIGKHYARYIEGPVEAEGPALGQRQFAHLARWSHTRPISQITMSPDGSYLAVGFDIYNEGWCWTQVMEELPWDLSNILKHSGVEVVGWGTDSGAIVLGPLYVKSEITFTNPLWFSVDLMRVMMVLNDGHIWVFNTETGGLLLRFHPQGELGTPKLSPSGGLLAAVVSDLVKVWDTQNGDVVHCLAPLDTTSSTDLLLFSPDDSRVIGASSVTNSVCAWDTQTGNTVLATLQGNPGAIWLIECSPNGRHIAIADYGHAIYVWDSETGELVLGPLEGHTSFVTSLAFSPDSSRLFSGCQGRLMCVWDVQFHTPRAGACDALSEHMTSVKLSSNGAQFVSGSVDGTLCIWNTYTGDMEAGPIKVHTGRILAVDFLDNRIVSGSSGGRMCVWDIVRREIVLGPINIYFDKPIQTVQYSVDGNLILTEGFQGEIDTWEAHSGSHVLTLVSSSSFHRRSRSPRFSPDCTCVIIDLDGHLEVKDATNAQTLLTIASLSHNYPPQCAVAYSPNGAFIAARVGGEDDLITMILIFDAHTGATAQSLFLHRPCGVIRSISFSPDSTRLLSSSGEEILIWDTRTGEIVVEIPHGHNHWIDSADYSPDGIHVLSHSPDDMSIHVHDARSAEERAMSGSMCEFCDWTLNEGGWVVDDESRLLVWVPADLRRAVMRPRTEVIMSPYGYVRLKFDRTQMGDAWASCYTSESR
ncbi:NACHT domain [Rhizoctonia solani]|uniref:NACHT domain n=1 Tax=Rhizoctonia solani TaxID=456999 RepID=A0A8H7H514_9AGAM|nr:NACHT domain [Rhizoctonia solani]